MQGKQLKTLLVSFENELEPFKTSAFRGAVIEKVGRQYVAFHNHQEDNRVIYQYPQIQYKSIRRRPSLFCIGAGVDEIHHFFGLRSWDIELHGKKIPLKIHKLDLNNFQMNVWDKHFQYSMHNWLALNADNYRKYQSLHGLSDKVAFLERLLVGNILSFAKGIEWFIEKPVSLGITEINKQKTIRYKGVPLLAFDLEFSCNIFLPNYIGLGKSASHGFGVVRSLNKKQNSNYE